MTATMASDLTLSTTAVIELQVESSPLEAIIKGNLVRRASCLCLSVVCLNSLWFLSQCLASFLSFLVFSCSPACLCP